MEKIKNGWATGMGEGQLEWMKGSGSYAACSYRYPFGSLAFFLSFGFQRSVLWVYD